MRSRKILNAGVTNRRPLPSAAWVMVLAGTTALFGSPSRGAAPEAKVNDPRLQIALASLGAQLTSISTLEVDYDEFISNGPSSMPPDLAGKKSGPHPCELRLDGPKWSLKHLGCKMFGGDLEPYSKSYDGELSFFVQYDKQTDRILHLARLKERQRDIEAPGPLLFIGLQVPGFPCSLWELLTRPEIREQLEIKDDREGLLLLETPWIPTAEGEAARFQIWLDESVGFLPRRIISLRDRGLNTTIQPAKPAEDFTTTLEVLKYTTIVDQASNQPRQVPSEMRRTFSETVLSLLVTRAAINTAIPAERFTPAPPPGARVSDFVVPPGEASRAYIVGSLETQGEMLEAAVRDALDEPLPDALDVDARPLRSNWLMSLASWTSVTVLVLAFARRLLARRSRQTFMRTHSRSAGDS